MTIVSRIVYLKVGMRVELYCSYHNNSKIIIMGGEGCVNQPCCGKNFAIYKCIKSSHCTPLLKQYYMSITSIKLEKNPLPL